MGGAVSKVAKFVSNGVTSVATAFWNGIKKAAVYVNENVIKPVIKGIHYVVKRVYQIIRKTILHPKC